MLPRYIVTKMPGEIPRQINASADARDPNIQAAAYRSGGMLGMMPVGLNGDILFKAVQVLRS